MSKTKGKARTRRTDLGMEITTNGSSGTIPGVDDSPQFYSAVDASSATRQITGINCRISTTAPAPHQTYFAYNKLASPVN